MKVISKKGTSCPKEGTPRDYIDDKVPQEVPETAYYMRLVEDGSLIRPNEKGQKGKEDNR